MNRDNSSIVLEALLHGVPVKIGDMTYHWDVNVGLVHECKIYRNGTDQPFEITYMPNDMSLVTFYKLCQTLTFEEVFIIGANKVLSS